MGNTDSRILGIRTVADMRAIFHLYCEQNHLDLNGDCIHLQYLYKHLDLLDTPLAAPPPLYVYSAQMEIHDECYRSLQESKGACIWFLLNKIAELFYKRFKDHPQHGETVRKTKLIVDSNDIFSVLSIDENEQNVIKIC